MAKSSDLLQGTLDLLILRVLALGPLHGWGIAQRIGQISNDTFSINQGSLYPALHRLEGKSLVDTTDGTAENGRSVRFYQLTAAGRKAMQLETREWLQYTRAVQLIIDAT
jgi:PadR family transcriptional regulator PadR